MSPSDPADFASLLEREPAPEPHRETHEVCRETHDAACAAFERIKSLEGVLVAIRVKSAEGTKLRAGVPMETLANTRRVYLEEISSLVSETLDPHQSWCRGDHSEGACVSDLGEVDRGE